MDNKDYFLKITLPHEGGWSDHPSDKGGKTNKGITWNTLKRLKYDTNQDGTVDYTDLKVIQYDDIKFILQKAGYYNSDYDKLDPETAYFLTDWKWGGGHSWFNKYILPVFKYISGQLTPDETLSHLMIIRSYWYRIIMLWSPDNRDFKSGWFKKHISTGIRLNLGITPNYDTVLKFMKYDKNNSTGSLII